MKRVTGAEYHPCSDLVLSMAAITGFELEIQCSCTST